MASLLRQQTMRRLSSPLVRAWCHHRHRHVGGASGRSLRQFSQGADAAPSGIWDAIRQAVDTTINDEEHVGLLSRHQVLGWTYEELYQRALGVALGLSSLGVDADGRVLVCVDKNDSEKLLVQLGAPIAGVDVVVVDDPAHLVQAQEETNCTALIISPTNFMFFEDIADLPSTFELPPIVTGPVRTPPNDTGKPPVVLSFVELIAEVAAAPREELEEIADMLLDTELKHDDQTQLFFQNPHSATFALQPVVESQLVSEGKRLADLVQMQESDRVLIGTALGSTFGIASVLAAAQTGAGLVLTNIDPEPLSADAPPKSAPEQITVLSTLHDTKCSLLVSDDMRFHNIALPMPQVHDISSLRGGLVRGDPDSGLSYVYAGIQFETAAV